MSDSHKYLIFGHSDKTDEKFKLLRNVQLLFAAKEGEICTVPGTYESIIAEIETINPETPQQEENINYNISFYPNTTDGIYKLNYDNDHIPILIPLENKYDTTNTLQHYISFIRKSIRIGTIRPSDTITIYCIFCRGGNPEKFETNATELYNTYTEADPFWDLKKEYTGTAFLDTDSDTDFLDTCFLDTGFLDTDSDTDGGTVKCIKKNKKVKSRKNRKTKKRKNKKTKKRKNKKTRKSEPQKKSIINHAYRYK